MITAYVVGLILMIGISLGYGKNEQLGAIKTVLLCLCSWLAVGAFLGVLANDIESISQKINKAKWLK